MVEACSETTVAWVTGLIGLMLRDMFLDEHKTERFAPLPTQSDQAQTTYRISGSGDKLLGRRLRELARFMDTFMRTTKFQTAV